MRRQRVSPARPALAVVLGATLVLPAVAVGSATAAPVSGAPASSVRAGGVAVMDSPAPRASGEVQSLARMLARSRPLDVR
ncbi:MAG: hypothetical protein KGN38_10780, partial [Actinomycetales bacterium]|nr:hypothetical protein [Actinomycetales bacterium]